MTLRYQQLLCMVSLTFGLALTAGCTATARNVDDDISSSDPKVTSAEPTITEGQTPSETSSATTPSVSNPTESTEVPVPVEPTSTEVPVPSVSSLDPIPVCEGGIWDSSITSKAEFLEARGCTEINGNIRLEDETIAAIDFPVLERVNGHVFIDGIIDLTTLSMPALTTVNDGYIGINNNDALEEINLSGLTTLLGSLSIYNNIRLTTITMPVLISIESYSLRIEKNNSLTTLSLPVLTTVNADISITENDALTGISLPVLTTVGGIYIIDNDVLTACDLGSYTDSYCP